MNAICFHFLSFITSLSFQPHNFIKLNYTENLDLHIPTNGEIFNLLLKMNCEKILSLEHYIIFILCFYSTIDLILMNKSVDVSLKDLN